MKEEPLDLGGASGPGEVLEALESALARAASAQEVEEVLRRYASEAGVSPEALRYLLRVLQGQRGSRSLWGRFLSQFRQMEQGTRRVVASGFVGSLAGLFAGMSAQWDDPSGLLTILQILLLGLGVWNLALTRKAELGALAGGVLGLAYWMGKAFFSAIWLLFSSSLRTEIEGGMIIFVTLLGALLGAVIGRNSERLLQWRFRSDPLKRRAYLLRQLVELQEELKAGERHITFLSVDVVGSAEIKRKSEPLSAEHTFFEYVNYVREVGESFGGSVHSVSGDGVLLVFDHPQQAVAAGKRILSGMVEFNAFRNRTGIPFSLRCGVHTGMVFAPEGRVDEIFFSSVIDVAVHAQESAPPGGMVVTEDAGVYLFGGARSLGGEEVDVRGVRAYVWRSQASEALASSVGGGSLPPPLPPQSG